MKIFLIFISVISLFFWGTDKATGRSESNELAAFENIDSPLPDFYKSSKVARNPWNMVVFDGKLYVASGDYTANSGNTPIFTYDVESGEWCEPYVTRDEALEAFRAIDGKLYAVGNDSTLSGSVGNFYVFNGEWQSFFNVPGAAHVFDVASYSGKTFLAIGTPNGSGSPILLLGEDGKYSEVSLIKDGVSLFPSSVFGYSRVYNFFSVGGELYAFFLAPRLDGGKTSYEFYKYNGEFFEFVSELDGRGVGFYRVSVGEGGKRLTQNFFSHEFEKDGYAYFSTGALYRTKDFLTFERLLPEQGAIVTDTAKFGSSYYALGFRESEKVPGRYYNAVWKMEKDGSFTKVAELATKNAYALSLAVDGDDFFVGIGNRADGIRVGEIYRIRKTK